jgi:flagellar motor switch protein FliM
MASPQSYKRTLKLGAALGDWTRLRPNRDERRFVLGPVQGFDRLSEEDLKAAHDIHYRFFQEMAEHLSRTLEIPLTLGGVEGLQEPYQQFLQGVSAGPMVQIVLTNGAGISFTMYTDLPFSELVIHHLLGVPNGQFTGRTLSDIDQTLLLTGLTSSFKLLPKSFKNIFSIEGFSIEGTGTVVRDYTLNLQDTYVVFTAQFILDKDPEKSFTVTIGYVQNALRGWLAQLRPMTGGGPMRLERLPQPVTESYKLPVTAELGTTQVTMGEIHELQPGDVVPLDTLLHQPIALKLGETITLLAQPGLANGRLGAKVVTSRTAGAADASTVTTWDEPLSDLAENAEPETTGKTNWLVDEEASAGENDASEEDLDAEDDDLLSDDDDLKLDDDEKEEDGAGGDDWLKSK